MRKRIAGESAVGKLLLLASAALLVIVAAGIAGRYVPGGIRAGTAEERTELLNQVIPDDLVKFGLIPELIGRMPISVALKELSRDDLRRILTEPKNAITKQFIASFKMDNVDLEFTEDSIEAIADTAIKRKTGARGLRSIVEKLLIDTMFDAPSLDGQKKLVITKDIVEQKAVAVIETDTKQIPA